MIEDEAGNYLGCLYVYPLIAGDASADVVWWWQTGMERWEQALRDSLEQWLSVDLWPRLNYWLPPPGGRIQDDHPAPVAAVQPFHWCLCRETVVVVLTRFRGPRNLSTRCMHSLHP